MKRWTEEETDYLIGYSIDPEGEKIKDIANFLNRSEDAVKNKLKRLRKKETYVGYVQRRWTSKEKDILKEAINHMNYREIASVLGRSENSIMLYVQYMGLAKQTTSQKTLENLKPKIVNLAKQGYTRREISEKVGLPYTVIKNFIWSRKIKCLDVSNHRTKEQKEKHRNFMTAANRRK
ncbi:hypothetical protein TEHN7126_2343 [Tetragenococcus halophilus subsp. halophilus]|uniref:hypothetical protein n=1 Tax=Tetragenococcus halophilus TaxID=51669 RepID=UPI000CAB322F|nr:hypothetical protein [Tetragenococcus halophilus]GBD74088.1 hypothetical protein TEHN7125_2248 [Tetragenococcus halophilus subsp. halophilus]GBD76644.1 hypothetical protein TEHN7126_2343 [Tetragenococcus halophilus subsp. halophilus]